MLAAMPADMETRTWEQHGANHRVERAREYTAKEKKRRGDPSPPFIVDVNTPEDIRKFQVPWLANPHRVPPAIHQDYQTRILDVIDIDVCMWLKAMVPTVTKQYCRFRDLVYEVIVPSQGESPLLWLSLAPPTATTLRGSVRYRFCCLPGKEMKDVTTDDILLYLRSHIGLTQAWVREWIIPFVTRAHESNMYNLTTRHAKDAQDEAEAHKSAPQSAPRR
jgi:hypothetical protein